MSGVLRVLCWWLVLWIAATMAFVPVNWLVTGARSLRIDEAAASLLLGLLAFAVPTLVAGAFAGVLRAPASGRRGAKPFTVAVATGVGFFVSYGLWRRVGLGLTHADSSVWQGVGIVAVLLAVMTFAWRSHWAPVRADA